MFAFGPVLISPLNQYLVDLGWRRAQFGVLKGAPTGYNLCESSEEAIVLFKVGEWRTRYTFQMQALGGEWFNVWFACQEKRGERIICRWRVKFFVYRSYASHTGALGQWMSWHRIEFDTAWWALGRNLKMHRGMPVEAQKLVLSNVPFAAYQFYLPAKKDTYASFYINRFGMESALTRVEVHGRDHNVPPMRSRPYVISNEEKSDFLDMRTSFTRTTITHPVRLHDPRKMRAIEND